MPRAKLFLSAATVLAVAALAFAVYQSLPSSQSVPPPEAKAPGLTLGNADAPARIEVFEDLQCPACLRFTLQIEPRVIRELVETGKASYAFRHYPFLDGGDPKGESHRAAEASLCAAEQGKFWEYKSVVFSNWAGENVGTFRDENLLRFAESLSLNMDSFSACFQESRYAAFIEADLKLGDKMGVSGTPSVFVNGKQIRPGYIPSFEDIQAAVEEAQP